MRALAAFTCIGPADRIKRLIAFNNRLQSTPESLQKFTAWNLQLENRLVNVPGRVLPSETIEFGGNKRYKFHHTII